MPSLVKQNLNRTQKYKGIALKKIKGHFEGRYKVGALGALTHEAKFKQDVKTRSKHSSEDVIYGMGGLIRT